MKLPPSGASLRSGVSVRPSILVVLPVMTLLASACSSHATQASPPSDEALPTPEDRAMAPSPGMPEDDIEESLPASAALLLDCANEDVRACTYYLPEHNGVRHCVVGYQVCSYNQWGQCFEGAPVDGGPGLEPGGSF